MFHTAPPGSSQTTSGAFGNIKLSAQLGIPHIIQIQSQNDQESTHGPHISEFDRTQDITQLHQKPSGHFTVSSTICITELHLDR